ncbi:MAG: hypothetical protein P1P87_12675, partial [Trueperaceae bacterium]|nr:hypothetical protein [Trueperaceae bacterium]
MGFAASCTGFDGPGAPATNPSSIPCAQTDEANLETVLADVHADFTGVGFRAPALARSVSILDSAASLLDAVVELVYGPYEAQLRPFRPVAEDADTWGCGVRPSGPRNLGGYSPWSGTLFVCIDDDG